MELDKVKDKIRKCLALSNSPEAHGGLTVPVRGAAPVLRIGA